MNEAEARRQEGEELRHGEVKCQVDWLVTSMQHQVTVSREEVKRLNKLFAEQRKDLHHLKEYKDWAEVQLDADREAFSKVEYGASGRRCIVVNYGGLTGTKLPKVFKAHHLEFSRDALGVPISIFEKMDGTVGYAPLDFIQFYDGFAEEDKEDDNGHSA